MKRCAIVSILLLLIVVVFYLFVFRNWNISDDGISLKEISSFDDCVSAGFGVLESYPSQCRTSDGRSFTQDIGNELEMLDLIKVDNPRPNTLLISPLEIKGAARGTWFFEAQAGAKLLDEDGEEVATGIVQTEGDWMTGEFVGFSGELLFERQESGKGTLVLENANPSGLPENQIQLIIPVIFYKSI